MGFLHLFIVNRSGGLIHHRPLGPKAPQIGTNEWLRIGSTFHSLHAIAAEASPVRLPGNQNSSKLFPAIVQYLLHVSIVRVCCMRVARADPAAFLPNPPRSGPLPLSDLPRPGPCA